MASRADGYAAAIFEIARAEDVLDKVGDELYRFSHLLERSEALRDSLATGALPADRRQAVLEDLLGGRAHRVTTQVLSLMVGIGRAKDLQEIVTALLALIAKEREKAVAEVRSAVPLDADQRRRLSEALSSGLGQQVELRVVVDPAIMGGVVARVGDLVIDGSVRHRLEVLREAL